MVHYECTIRRLKEATAYTVPKSPLRLMCDFYVMAWCSTTPSDPTNVRNPASFISRRDLVDDIKETFDILIKGLRVHLLEVVKDAIISEWGHFQHRGWFPKAHEAILTNRQWIILKRLRSLLPRDYDGVNDVADTDPNGTISLARLCFLKGNWRNKYGGKAWANICDAYFGLQRANTTQEAAIHIDHIYDIEHNTGTLFTKSKEYSSSGMGDGYKWIKEMLDVKASMTTIEPLLSKCSSYVRKIGYATMKMAGVPLKSRPASTPPVPMKYPPLSGAQFLEQHPGWGELYKVILVHDNIRSADNWCIYALMQLSTGNIYSFYGTKSGIRKAVAAGIDSCNKSDILAAELDAQARSKGEYSGELRPIAGSLHDAQYAARLRERDPEDVVSDTAWELPDLAALHKPAAVDRTWAGLHN